MWRSSDSASLSVCHLRLTASVWPPLTSDHLLSFSFLFSFSLCSDFSTPEQNLRPTGRCILCRPGCLLTPLTSLKSWSVEEKAARTKNGHPLRSVFPLGVEMEKGSDWHVVMWMKISSFSFCSPGSAIDSPPASSDLINRTHLLATSWKPASSHRCNAPMLSCCDSL